MCRTHFVRFARLQQTIVFGHISLSRGRSRFLFCFKWRQVSNHGRGLFQCPTLFRQTRVEVHHSAKSWDVLFRGQNLQIPSDFPVPDYPRELVLIFLAIERHRVTRHVCVAIILHAGDGRNISVANSLWGTITYVYSWGPFRLRRSWNPCPTFIQLPARQRDHLVGNLGLETSEGFQTKLFITRRGWYTYIKWEDYAFTAHITLPIGLIICTFTIARCCSSRIRVVGQLSTTCTGFYGILYDMGSVHVILYQDSLYGAFQVTHA